MARPTPVLPEVGSMMVAPGLSSPLFSAASTMPSAMRSLMAPPGLLRSDLIQTLRFGPNRRLMRMCGVLPMVCRTLSAFIRLLGWAELELTAAIFNYLIYQFRYMDMHTRDNPTVKPTRLPLVQSWKQGTGGTSGLHR